jgi:uncharacterized protein
MMKQLIKVTYLFSLALTVMLSTAYASPVDDLLRAVTNDDTSSLSTLFLRGADPNATDDKGQSLLHVALQSDAFKAARALVNHPKINLNHKTPNDESPLMMAAFKGELSLATVMIKKGALVNKTGWAPLHYAATNGHKAMVALLLEENAYIDAEAPSKTTPLMMAARHGHADVVKLLMEEGADVTPKNVHGFSAMDFAKGTNRADIAALLATKVPPTVQRKGWN